MEHSRTFKALGSDSYKEILLLHIRYVPR